MGSFILMEDLPALEGDNRTNDNGIERENDLNIWSFKDKYVGNEELPEVVEEVNQETTDASGSYKPSWNI